jgi:hypothetical protein|tara:strand:- start:9276 stop:11039 length:1764 start_codon:yes stop_codon:yes gene_type:complete
MPTPTTPSLTKTIQKLQAIEFLLRDQIKIDNNKQQTGAENLQNKILIELTDPIDFNDYDLMGALDAEDLSSISSFIDYINCPFYQPFLFWNEIREMALNNKDDGNAIQIINDFLCTFLEQGIESDKYVAFFEYFEAMLYTYIAHKHICCKEEISQIFDNISGLWENKGSAYWPIMRYIRRMQNDINNKNVDIEQIYNTFIGYINIHPYSYGFEFINQIRSNQDIHTDDNKGMAKNNDNILEAISLLCAYNNSHHIKFKDFKELVSKYYMGDGKHIEGYYEMCLNVLGHISRNGEKIFVLPPTLNRIHFNLENGICRYLLSGARTRELITFLQSSSQSNNIEFSIISQPFSWAPNAIILEGAYENVKLLTEDINSKLGEGFLTINQNKQIAASAFISYNINDASLKDLGLPGAGYERKRYFCESSFTFSPNEPDGRNIVLVEYHYMKYNALSINHYYIKRNNLFYKCEDKQTAILQLYSLRNLDFLIYNKESKQLIVPKYFNFPTTIAKGLTIKSGMLPKELSPDDNIHIKDIILPHKENQGNNHIFTRYRSLRDIPGFKSYSNISEKDIALLLKSLNQQSIAISKIH